MPLDPENDETIALTSPPQAALKRTTSIGNGGGERFASGALLASRYRIVSRFGKGGMGEVFRADGILLGQPVALKFLPETAIDNLNLLTRFYDEVRIARQISHGKVCRVYDIGEMNGQPYRSMEYIDGEDMSSLPRRIGRLPGDKAAEFARKIYAGVAAAHAQGKTQRKPWLATAAFLVLFGLYRGMGSGATFWWVGTLLALPMAGIVLFVLIRYGLLALILTSFVSETAADLIMTTDLTAWYGLSSVVMLILLVAMTAWGFRLAIGNRTLLSAPAP